MVRVGVVGYGYWGPNVLRNFAEAPGAQVLTVCDLRPDRLALVHGRYPAIQTVGTYEEVVGDPRIDAIAIATPVSTHFDLALGALRAGKHVLLEKPLTATADQAARLIEEAGRQGCVLMVDHTFVYTGAVRKIRELVASNELGDIYYYDSVRVNLGLFQHDVNVLWDLAVHDLSVLDYVMPGRPIAVSATGVTHVPNMPENIAYLTLFYDTSLIAHIHVNWLAPVKVRRTLIGGRKKMIVYDDLEPSEKVKLYDCGLVVTDDMEAIYHTRVGYRTGDMWAPKLDTKEPLQTEVLEFIQCVEQGKRPMSDGQAGLRIVRILEAATRSMKEQGKPVALPKEG